MHLLAIVSHRHLRYASGLLHLILFASTLALLRAGKSYRLVFGAQALLLATAAARPGISRYYVAVTWATLPALVTYVRSGASPVWEKAAGSR